MTPNKIRIVTITILLYNHTEGKINVSSLSTPTMNNYKQCKMMNHNVIQVRLIPADYITE